MPPSVKAADKRILIITDAWRPQVNGVVRTYEYLAAELEKLGHIVKVIGPVDFPHRFPLPGYQEIELVIAPARRLARMIEEFRPTSIHIGTEGPLGRAARRYCLRRDLPFSTAYHTQFPDYVARRMPFAKNLTRQFVDGVMRRFHAPAAAVITTTETMTAELKVRGYGKNLYVMPRGVPADLFQPAAATLFADLKRPIALYVGRVAVEKNIEDFLKMAWDGSKVVVGDGPSLEVLQEQYKDVLFAGRQTGNTLAHYYQSADIFVFPSKTDTFGIVLLEALSCGLPVAAYDVVGPRDIIVEPFLGALHKDDLASAARQALSLSADKNTRHDYARAHYSWAAAAQRFLSILDQTGS